MPIEIRLRPGAVAIEREDGIFVGHLSENLIIQDRSFRSFLREIYDWREPIELAERLSMSLSEMYGVISQVERANLLEQRFSKEKKLEIVISHFNEIGSLVASILFEYGCEVTTLDKRSVSLHDVHGQFIRVENVMERFDEILVAQKRELINSGNRLLHSVKREEKSIEITHPANQTLNNLQKERIVLITTYPEPELLAELMSEGIAHLIVMATPSGALLGPIIYPGLSPCFHCEQLHRSDSDPEWQKVEAIIFSARHEAIPLPHALLAASQAAHYLLKVAGICGRARGNGEELALGEREISHEERQWSFHENSPQSRRWNFHPECSCLWGKFFN